MGQELPETIRVGAERQRKKATGHGKIFQKIPEHIAAAAGALAAENPAASRIASRATR